MPFRIAIEEERREDLFKYIEDGLKDAQSDRSSFDRRRVSIYHAYRNRPKKKVKPFPGCSNVSMPIITRAAERMTVQTQQTVAPRGVFSSISATPITQSGVKDLQDRADTVASYLTMTFRNRMNLAEAIEPFFRSGILYGNAYGKLWFRREFQNLRMVERIPALSFVLAEGEDEEDPEAKYDVVRVPVEVSIRQFFSNRPNMKIESSDPGSGAPPGTEAWKVEFYDESERRYREIQVEGYYDEDHGENVLLMKGREMVVNRPEFSYIRLDDVYFTMESESINDSSRVWVRQDLTFSQIVQKYRMGIFNQINDEDIEDLRQWVRKDHIVEGATEKEITAHSQLDRPAVSVSRKADKVEGAREDREENLDVWEVFMTFDIDGDDEDEEIVVWVEFNTRKILRIAHLYEDYHSNDRPFVEWGLIPIENRTLKAGVGEFLMPLKVEIDALFNNRSDAASVTLMPSGFYRPGSGFYPGKVQWQPGMWIPVDSPRNDVAPNVYTNNARDTINVEQFLLALVEDISISTYALGRGPDRPNAPRTARGTLAILQQDAVKMDYIIKRLTPALEAICHKTLYLLRVFGQEEEEFRVLGTNEVRTLRPEDLDNRYSFYLDVDTVSANKEIQRIYAQQAFEAVGPIAQQDPAAVSPGLRLLGRNLLEKLDFKNANEVLPEPPGFERMSISQEEENVALYHGVSVQPILSDDHRSHLLVMDEEETLPRFNSMPREWVEQVWKPHKQMHVELLRQQMAQQQALLRGTGAGGVGAGAGAGAAPPLPALSGVAPGNGAEFPGSTLSGTAQEAEVI